MSNGWIIGISRPGTEASHEFAVAADDQQKAVALVRKKLGLSESDEVAVRGQLTERELSDLRVSPGEVLDLEADGTTSSA